MRLLVFTILFYLYSEIKCEITSTCFLPTGGLGWCTPLQQCHHFVDILKNLQKPLPTDVGLVLRESFFCENRGSTFHVCCSGDNEGTEKQLIGKQRNSCELQNGLGAECVPYDKCSPFIQLMANLRKPLPRSTPTLIRSSFLCGQDSERNVPKICCPSAALTPRTDPPSTEKPSTEETTESQSDTDRFADHPARSALGSTRTCGLATVNKRIVGGKTATIGQYNWLANLGYVQTGGSETLFKCGGSLIGKRYVLTAAHCVIQLPSGFSLATVRLGEYDLSQDVDCQDNFCSDSPQDFKVESIIPHPDYGKPAAFQNDIAIIKLSEEAVISDFVSPICLPYTHEKDDYITTRSSLDDTTKVEVAGWGATTKFGREPADVLQFLSVNVTDFDTCKETYAKRGGVLNDKQICAGGEKGKDSCVGDSGSALMRSQLGETFDQWALIGIVSFGPRLCGTEGIPGVYTRVNSYIPWILQATEKLENNQ